MTASRAAPATATETEARCPMTEAALKRLIAEETRLVAMARDLGAPAPGSEAPDAAAVASSIREVDSIARRIEAVRTSVDAADISTEPDVAVIGRSVRIREDGVVDTFRLVIPGAGDPSGGAISIDSPLGGALVGSRAGDQVEYATPGGDRSALVEAVDAEDAIPF